MNDTIATSAEKPATKESAERSESSEKSERTDVTPPPRQAPAPASSSAPSAPPPFQCNTDLVEAGTAWPIPNRDAFALVKYAAERGLNHTDNLLVPLYDAARACETATTDSERLAAENEKLRLYGELTQITINAHGVNGRKIIDSACFSNCVRGLLTASLAFLVLAVTFEITQLWLNSQLAMAEMPAALKAVFATTKEVHVLNYLKPFFWGAVGSCVYLLKRLSDLAAVQNFEKDRLQGKYVRVFLGAVFGGIVVNSFGLQPFLDSANGEPTQVAIREAWTIQITGSAVAFLCGLGVRAVYAAFERVIEYASERFSRMGKREEEAAERQTTRQFLLRQLAETPRETETAKREAIRSLLEELDKKPVAKPA